MFRAASMSSGLALFVCASLALEVPASAAVEEPSVPEVRGAISSESSSSLEAEEEFYGSDDASAETANRVYEEGGADDANDSFGGIMLENSSRLAGRCGSNGSTSNTGEVLKNFARSKDHPRMISGRATLNCGHNDYSREESVYGLRHIKARHQNEFEGKGGEIGYDWDVALEVWMRETLSDPDVRKVYPGRFCYAKKFEYFRDDRRILKTWVMVILGETGRRVITSFTNRKSQRCVKGDAF